MTGNALRVIPLLAAAMTMDLAAGVFALCADDLGAGPPRPSHRLTAGVIRPGAVKPRKGHIPWDNVDRRLRSMREIWIATTSPAGRPDATPIWFWWDGSAAYFTCASVARKARNIAAQSEVVLLNGDGTDPIILKGRAERVLARAELERVDEAYREKYVDPGTGERATIFVADDHVYRVQPHLVAVWAYATAANRTEFVRDEA